jgi:hypothetical protein
MTKPRPSQRKHSPAFLPAALAQPISGKWLSTSCATWPNSIRNPDRFGRLWRCRVDPAGPERHGQTERPRCASASSRPGGGRSTGDASCAALTAFVMAVSHGIEVQAKAGFSREAPRQWPTSCRPGYPDQASHPMRGQTGCLRQGGMASYPKHSRRSA